VHVGRAGREQDVAAGQVAVHEPAAVQELHARRDLGRRRQQHGPVGLPAAGPEQALDHRLLRAPRGARASTAQRAARLGGVARFGCKSESLDVTVPTASCARLCGGRGSARRRVNLGSMAGLNRPFQAWRRPIRQSRPPAARALERQLQRMQRRCWGRPARRTPQTSSTDSLLTLLG